VLTFPAAFLASFDAKMVGIHSAVLFARSHEVLLLKVKLMRIRFSACINTRTRSPSNSIDMEANIQYLDAQLNGLFQQTDERCRLTNCNQPLSAKWGGEGGTLPLLLSGYRSGRNIFSSSCSATVLSIETGVGRFCFLALS